jgi:hypothetical protein
MREGMGLDLSIDVFAPESALKCRGGLHTEVGAPANGIRYPEGLRSDAPGRSPHTWYLSQCFAATAFVNDAAPFCIVKR